MENENIIKILNREYHIKEQEDPLLLAALAKYVEDKMIEVSQKNNLVDTSRIAVHAALVICKELFDERNKGKDLEKNQERRCSEMLKELSRIMES